MIRFLVLLALVTLSAIPGRAQTAAPSGYTVSRVSDGIRLTLHFSRRRFPAHALVAVTATIRNLSHPNLAVGRGHEPYGLCNWPAISMESVNAQGQNAEPPSPVPIPTPPCPFPGIDGLPIGHSVVEHQLIELWSPRLKATAQLFNHVNNGYEGFSFAGPAATFRLRRSPAPTIYLGTWQGMSAAFVSPPLGARGQMYYRSWGSCADYPALSETYYWRSAPSQVVSFGCPQPKQWHLDVAWLNSPVATINLGNPPG